MAIVGVTSALDEQHEQQDPEAAATQVFVEGTFAALLSRDTPKESWGVMMDFMAEKFAHVCRLREDVDSPVRRWNQSVGEEHQLQVGDYIVAINGISNASVPAGSKTSEVMRSLVTASELTMILQCCRPHVFEVKLERSSQRMGLDLGYTKVCNTLIVSSITEGAAKLLVPEVRVGDRIISIGEVSGSPDKLLEAISTMGQNVILTFSRPSVEVKGRLANI